MLSTQNIPEKKAKILEHLRRRGPSLPSSISSSINLSLLFTSALLSEMHRDGTIKMSHLKIGGSPLYLLEGQESQLDRFTKHLEKKEQEALDHLRKNSVLEDEKIEPSHRVALRNIRDFAIMMRITLGDQEKIFWRLNTLTKEETEKKIKDILEKGRPRKKGKELRLVAKPKEKEKKEEKEKKIPRKKKKKEEIESKIIEYLKTNNLALIKEIKQGDVFGVAISTTPLGRMKFLIMLKNKKKISNSDITLALHEGQKNKMPVLMLTPGTLTKKTEKYAEENSGYVLIKNIKI
jgi:hypothetical protein